MNPFRRLFGRRTREADLDAEIESHLKHQISDSMSSGMSEEQARHLARKSFGNISQVKEEVRDAWGWTWLDRLMQDLRYSIRVFDRSRAFTAVAILTIAIGIGASTAIFSQVNAVFFKTVAAKNAEELRVLSWTSPRRGFTSTGTGAAGQAWDMRMASGGTIDTFSYSAYLHMRDTTRTFAGLTCWQDPGENWPVVLNEWGRVETQLVSSNYFQVLGTDAVLGRTFTPADDRGGKTDMIAVISWSLWQKAFKGDATVLDRTLAINGTPYVIAGVLPQEFIGLGTVYAPEIVLPITTLPTPMADINNGRDWRACHVLGRIRSGVSDEQARTEMETSIRQAILADPPKEAYEMPRVWIADAAHGNEAVRGLLSKPLLLVITVAAILLLIGCANIGGLLLTRSVFRRKEIATRFALGAPRSRVVWQLITESLLLSFAGGIAGAGLAYGLNRLVPNILSQVIPGAVGTVRETAINSAVDLNVFAFALVLAFVTGLFFGLIPALYATRMDLLSMMKRHEPKSRAWRVGFANGKGFITIQVGLSLLLLVGAGLFIRTVINMRADPLGFDPAGLLLFRIEPRLSGYTPERRQDFFESVLNRLNGLPGIVSASGSVIPVLGNVNGAASICVPGFTAKDPSDNVAGFSSVAPRFFETIRLPMRAGRDVQWSDHQGTAGVILINEAFANKYYPGKDPIGQQLGGPGCPGEGEALTVVGVVADSKSRLRMEARPTFYPAYRQRPTNLWMTIVVRTTDEPSQMIPTIQRAIAELDPTVPVLDAIDVVSLRDRLMARERVLAYLLIYFATLAMLLAAIGIYGMLSYSVNWRTAEIGVRMALGAQQLQVIRMVLRESLVPVVIGVAVGLIMALALTRLVESMLFGVSRNDPWTIAASMVVFLLAAGFGAFVPARRASRIDPMRALRYE